MTEENKLPEWFEEFATQYGAGISREFVLFGNISDLVRNPDAEIEPEKPYISFREFWEKILDRRQMIVLYSMAWGLRFPSGEMERRFREASGFDAQPKDGKKNPLAEAGVIQKKRLPQDPETCFLLIEKVLRNIKTTAVMIYFAHHVVPVGAASDQEKINIERLIQWASSMGIKESEGIVLLLTDKIANIASELRESNCGIKTIMVPRPSKEERKTFLQAITVKPRAKKAPATEDGDKFSVPANFDLNAFSVATQGMSYQQILEMFLRSKKTGETITLGYAKAKKAEILNTEYGEYLEIIEPVMGLEDIGGLDYVKERFELILKAMETGNNLLVPQNITLMGPPGTGKTCLAEGLAKGAGFNFVKVRNMRNMFVGVSEERIQNTIYALKSLYPVVVMNDEGEEMESKRDGYTGDSGVTNRMRRAWMDFMGDTRIQGKVLVITCTNRPDLIDPAFKRSGRSDDRIPILMPSEEERKKIFGVIFKFLKIPTSITDFSKVAKLADNKSGADIKLLIQEANRLAFMRGKDKVNEALLEEAIKDLPPSASQEEIDRMTVTAIRERSSEKLVPANIKEILQGIKARGLVKIDDSLNHLM